MTTTTIIHHFFHFPQDETSGLTSAPLRWECQRRCAPLRNRNASEGARPGDGEASEGARAGESECQRVGAPLGNRNASEGERPGESGCQREGAPRGWRSQRGCAPRGIGMPARERAGDGEANERVRPVGGAVLLTPGFSLGLADTLRLAPRRGAASINRCSDGVGGAAYRAQLPSHPCPGLKPGVSNTAHLRRAHSNHIHSRTHSTLSTHQDSPQSLFPHPQCVHSPPPNLIPARSLVTHCSQRLIRSPNLILSRTRHSLLPNLIHGALTRHSPLTAPEPHPSTLSRFFPLPARADTASCSVRPRQN